VNVPFAEEVELARSNAGGWVYRVAGSFAPSDPVPPEAIVGAWKVDGQGDIIGHFIANERYDATRWPTEPR
jgi:hypothetical protein